MKNINVNYVLVKAKPGADLNNCIQEALILSLKEGRKVYLVHNDRQYRIEFDKLIGEIRKVSIDVDEDEWEEDEE